MDPHPSRFRDGRGPILRAAGGARDSDTSESSTEARFAMPQIASGRAIALFAFDVGYSLSLERAAAASGLEADVFPVVFDVGAVCVALSVELADVCDETLELGTCR